MILTISSDKMVVFHYHNTLANIAHSKLKDRTVLVCSIHTDEVRDQVMELLVCDGYTVTKAPNFRTLLTVRW